MVVTKSRASASIIITLGNIEFNNLQIIPAQCKLAKVLSYGCQACQIKPYVIFRASNIKNRGILPFESNCTFNKNYLSCNDEPYKLELLSDSKYCTIIIPSINHTLAIDFELEFLGTLDFSKSTISIETPMEVVKSVLSSQGYLDGLVLTFGTCTVLSFASAILIKIIKIYEFRRIARETTDNI